MTLWRIIFIDMGSVMAEFFGLILWSVIEHFFEPVLKSTGQLIVYLITFGQKEVDDTTAYIAGIIFWIIILAVVLIFVFKH
ncbi:hypothetical protein BH11PLA2_BH11PLA2_41870 [soil metagenome]